MKTRVLVVDDDVVSRMMLMHLVDSCGDFDIDEAEDGEEAWERLEAGPAPNIIFCDLRMPRLSGLELLRRMRAGSRHADIPFVLATSANDLDTVEQAGDYGACGFITKPLVPAQVREHLDRCLGTTQAETADETPEATKLRLNINDARLLAYLGGLHKQLVQAEAETCALLAAGETGAARLRLARLQEGCATLGLAAAARVLGACSLAPDEASVPAALAEATATVDRQLAALRQRMD